MLLSLCPRELISLQSHILWFFSSFFYLQEYRAVVQSTIDGPMVRVKLIVSQHILTRLVSPDMILGRYMGRWGSSGKKEASEDGGKKAAPGGISVSPSTTGDVSDSAVSEES